MPSGTYTATDRKRHLFQTYGLTEVDYNNMYREQRGCCAICDRPEKDAPRQRLFVDHCHHTKVVRGLLCGRCNTAIGNLNDDPVLVESALNYLRN